MKQTYQKCSLSRQLEIVSVWFIRTSLGCEIQAGGCIGKSSSWSGYRRISSIKPAIRLRASCVRTGPLHHRCPLMLHKQSDPRGTTQTGSQLCCEEKGAVSSTELGRTWSIEPCVEESKESANIKRKSDYSPILSTDILGEV